MSTWGFASALLLMGSTLASAALPSAPSQVSPEVIITAQSLVFKNHDNTALFTGNVVLTKGDFVMQADQMIVYFAAGVSPALSRKGGRPGESPQAPAAEVPTFGNRAVSLIDATGNVTMQQGHKKTKSQKAVYHQREERLVLTGDPEAWEAGYRVTGTKMTLFLKEDRSLVEGSRVVINETESPPQ